MDKIKRLIANGIVILGGLLLAIAVIMLCVANATAISGSAGFGILLIFPLVMMIVGYVIIAKTKPIENRQSKWRAALYVFLAFVMLFGVLIGVAMGSLVETLTISTTVGGMLMAGAIMLVVGSITEMIADRGRFASVVACSLLVMLIIATIWLSV